MPFSLLLLASPAVADTIVLKDGTSETVEEIKRATCEEVAFEVRRSTQRRDASEVERVVREGDRWLDSALRLLEQGTDPQRTAEYLQRSLSRGEDWAKPYAQFFLAELYARHDRQRQAVAAYEKVPEQDPKHFYAPIALERAARIYRSAGKAEQAAAALDRLASGEFGDYWRDKGSFAKARRQLAAGEHDAARSTFSELSRSSRDDALQQLATCGEAHARLLAGETDGARRSFGSVLRNSEATPQAKGYAWRGLGGCEEADGNPKAAVLAYLRSYLLYPSNPEARSAAGAASKVVDDRGWSGAQRLQDLSRSPARLGDYAGDQPDAALMKRCLQNVSAALVRRFAKGLIEEASGPEKAELEFTRADAMKAQAKANDDPDLLADYEELLAELQEEYPDHQRAALAGIDAFQAAKDRALALINRAKDQTDPEEKDALLEEGRSLFADNIEPFKETIEELTARVDALYEKEARGELSEAERGEKQETEFRRDLAEFLLAEAYASYAKAFPEGSDERTENLEKALEAYDHYVNFRGSYIRFLFYSYVGRGETLLALGKHDDAIMQFQELTYVKAPYTPEDPQRRKEVEELVKDVCIRAYYGWTRALNLAGKGEQAFEAAQAIEEEPKAEGWRDHPVGILLVFERAKALAGAGRGADGAEELYGIIRKAKQVPDSEKIGGLGMSKTGAGACRALSELSDQTGGEIYSPEIQYHVGIGYFLRRQPELAVAAFKGVLTAARTEAERREWVPKAVKEIGNILFQEERYLEAALAYQTVFSEFPDHEQATEAVRFALSAAKNAVTQFGESLDDDGAPIVSFYREIERQAVASDEERGPNITMNNAAELQQDGQWVLAAEKYLEVPAEVTTEEGRTIEIEFYANAIANAGYCYFQAYQKKGQDQEHLQLARKHLGRAADIAQEGGDRDAQSLACYYLGNLEGKLDRHEEALEALQPFNNVLSNTKRYIVRARYQQALAHIALDQVSQAEAAFRKVEDETDDPYYSTFAYTMGRALRIQAGEVYNEDRDRLGRARRLRVKAAEYIRAWFQSEAKEGLQAAHYWWAGNVLFAGGLWEDTAALYEEGLERYPRPELNGSEAATEANETRDTAEMKLGYSLAMTGRAQEAYDVLTRLQRTVYIRNLSGNVVGRGVFEERVLSDRTFRVSREGRTQERRWWFTVVEIGGEEVRFFDTSEPRSGSTEFQGVRGEDPTAAYTTADERTIVRELMRDYYVVDGRARAAWALWEAEGDEHFLADEVTAASNELRYVLQSMNETHYARMAATTQIAPPDFTLRKWTADVQYLRIKLAREQWRKVVSDIEQMKLLGTFDRAPDPIKEELEEILEAAEAKQ